MGNIIKKLENEKTNLEISKCIQNRDKNDQYLAWHCNERLFRTNELKTAQYHEIALCECGLNIIVFLDVLSKITAYIGTRCYNIIATMKFVAALSCFFCIYCVNTCDSKCVQEITYNFLCMVIS